MSDTARKFLYACATLLGIDISPAVQASPADYVFIPYADAGARYLAYSFGIEKHRDGGSEQAHYLAAGWSPTSRWFTQINANWYKEPDAGLGFYASSWINHFQITAAGQSPVDLGLYLEVERPRERDEGYEIKWGPTIQWDTDHLQTNLNLFFARSIRTDQASSTTLSYQWQVKRLWQKGIELGAQGLGLVGPWQHWSASHLQEHVAGPAIFAHWAPGNETQISLDAAILFGTTTGSPRNTLRLHSQYQF